MSQDKLETLKTWHLNDKKITAVYNNGTIECHVITNLNQSIISQENIVGIPFDKLIDADSSKQFLANTHIKLHPLDNNNFKLHISHNLNGGANIIDPQKEPTKLWPQGIIPFEMDTTTYPVGEKERQEILDAIAEWNKANTGFILVPRTDQKDYLIFGEAKNKCNSFVGRRGGAQYVCCYLNNGKFNIANIMREIGHAIGFYHEHQRSDRNKHIQVNSNDKLNYEIEGKPYGEYDFDSIMHYYFDENLQPKYEFAQPKLVGKTGKLSKGDIEAAKFLYQESLNENDNVPQNNPTTPKLTCISMFKRKDNPPVWKQLYSIAKYYFKNEEYKSAFKYYSALLSEYSSVLSETLKSKLYTQLGNCCYEQKKYNQASNFFELAFQFDPRNSEAENRSFHTTMAIDISTHFTF